jgi:hypothetical protein
MTAIPPHKGFSDVAYGCYLRPVTPRKVVISRRAFNHPRFIAIDCQMAVMLAGNLHAREKRN